MSFRLGHHKISYNDYSSLFLETVCFSVQAQAEWHSSRCRQPIEFPPHTFVTPEEGGQVLSQRHTNMVSDLCSSAASRSFIPDDQIALFDLRFSLHGLF